MSNWWEKLHKIESEIYQLRDLLDRPNVDEAKVSKRINELLKERNELLKRE